MQHDGLAAPAARPPAAQIASGRGRRWVAGGLAGVCLLVAASSAGAAALTAPAGAANSKRPAPSAATRKAFQAYQSCLQAHGVTLPKGHRRAFGPGGPGAKLPAGGHLGGQAPVGAYPDGPLRGAKPGTFTKAQAACKAKLPAGAGASFGRFQGGVTPTTTPAQAQAFQTYISCMQSHGVQISSTATFQQVQSLLRQDSSAKSAQQACSGDLRSAFKPPPGRGPPPKRSSKK